MDSTRHELPDALRIDPQIPYKYSNYGQGDRYREKYVRVASVLKLSVAIG
jgi:hypothetical protein